MELILLRILSDFCFLLLCLHHKKRNCSRQQTLINMNQPSSIRFEPRVDSESFSEKPPIQHGDPFVLVAPQDIGNEQRERWQGSEAPKRLKLMPRSPPSRVIRLTHDDLLNSPRETRQTLFAPRTASHSPVPQSPISVMSSLSSFWLDQQDSEDERESLAAPTLELSRFDQDSIDNVRQLCLSL